MDQRVLLEWKRKARDSAHTLAELEAEGFLHAETLNVDVLNNLKIMNANEYITVDSQAGLCNVGEMKRDMESEPIPTFYSEEEAAESRAWDEKMIRYNEIFYDNYGSSLKQTSTFQRGYIVGIMPNSMAGIIAAHEGNDLAMIVSKLSGNDNEIQFFLPYSQGEQCPKAIFQKVANRGLKTKNRRKGLIPVTTECAIQQDGDLTDDIIDSLISQPFIPSFAHVIDDIERGTSKYSIEEYARAAASSCMFISSIPLYDITFYDDPRYSEDLRGFARTFADWSEENLRNVTFIDLSWKRSCREPNYIYMKVADMCREARIATRGT